MTFRHPHVWATLKRELAWIHRRQTWPTRDLLRSVIFATTSRASATLRGPRRVQSRKRSTGQGVWL